MQDYIKQIFNSEYDKYIHKDWNGSANMAFDLERATQIKDGAKPFLRIYSWQPAALSLGYNQKDNDIRYDLLKQDGIDCVRRPTGGRAVLHIEELTYSFALQLTNVNHHHIYKLFHLALLDVFSKIGIECDYEKAGAGRESFKEAICFISPAKFELTKDGKKIVGSAQRILDGNILLQHGSIPLNDKYKLIAKYTTSEQNQYERYSNIVNQKSTSLSSLVSKAIDFDNLANLILNQS